MKKLFSLLTLALLTMSVGAKVVTVDFVGMYNENTSLSTVETGEGITLTFAKATGSNVPAYNANAKEVRMYKNTQLTVAADEGYTITNIDFTFSQSKWQQSPSSANVGTVGSDGNWIGSANTVIFTNNYETNTQIRFTKMEITIVGGDTPPVTDKVAAPEFDPNGGTYSDGASVAVTVDCATQGASIQLYEVVDGEFVYVNDYYPQNGGYATGTFYVTETGTYAAYGYKNGMDYSDTTYVTFTFVTPKVATPTFNPASGTEFEDELDVTISCATPGATILYSYGEVMEEAEAPVTITLTGDATISAVASLAGYEDSDEATATYTKKTVVPAGGTYELVTDVTTLQAGDKIALVGLKDAEAYVMSEQRTNNFGGAAIVIADNKFTTDLAINITLEENGDNWNLKTDYGYLYANSSSSNQLKAETTLDSNGNANASITNGENNEASIVFQGTSTRNILRFNYNNNNPTLFSCYGSVTQLPVYIYKLTSGEVVIPAAPTISPESQNFTDPIEVTITNNEPGATVMYALNDGEFTEYTAAIPVSETTTVKAYATKDGATSSVVEETYTYVPAAVTVANLAEVNELDSAAVFTFTGNIVVTHKNGKNLWVRDDSGSALIYNTTDSTIVKGVVIAPNWGGRKTIYLGETEIDNLTDFVASGTTQEVLPFERETLTMDNYAEYAIIKNVSIDSTYTSGNRTNYVTNTGVIVRNNWNIAFTPEAGATYNFIGVVSAYQGVPQLNIIEVEGYVPEVNEPATIAEAAALTDGEEFTFIGEATVVYQNGKNLWIKDNSGYGLIFGTNPSFEQGTVLKDEWTAKKATYSGFAQFTDAAGLEDSGDRVEVNPEEKTTITADDIHMYVSMKNQTLTATVSKTWVNADDLLFYNKFNFDLAIEDGKSYDVVGIVTLYQGAPEVYIISATEVVAPEWEVGDVNHDHNIDVSDVTLLIAYVLGNNPEGFYVTEANVNDGDDNIDVGDVTALIAKVLAN